MSRRDTERATRKRQALIEKLGGKCAWCEATEDLEIDHIHGRDWTPREVSSDTRALIYEQEAEDGLLQVLCKSCNSSKGDHDFPRNAKKGENRKRRRR